MIYGAARVAALLLAHRVPDEVEVVRLLGAGEAVLEHVRVHRLSVLVLGGVELVAHLLHDAIDPALARLCRAIQTPLAPKEHADACGADEENGDDEQLEL